MYLFGFPLLHDLHTAQKSGGTPKTSDKAATYTIGLLRSMEKSNIADDNNKVGSTFGFGNVFTLRIAAAFRL